MSGRTPPSNVEAEAALLGGMLLSSDAIAAALDEGLASDDFYRPSHGMIYAAIVSLHTSGEATDPVSVAERLRRQGDLESAGGASVLVTLQAQTPAISSAPRYARVTRENSALRQLIAAADRIHEEAYAAPENVSEALRAAEEAVLGIHLDRRDETFAASRDVVSESLAVLTDFYRRGKEILGIPTGYRDLDRLLSGLQSSTLTIIGARPSMGKTSFALSIASNIATTGVPVLFFSLEMSQKEISSRLLSSASSLESEAVRLGRVSRADLSALYRAYEEIEQSNLLVDDNPLVTIPEIMARIRRVEAERGGLGAVVVDYLQLMSSGGRSENRQVEIAQISRGLKILARETRVPIVALSQLSRSLETRADKRPILSDLRDSGGLEQDADTVVFLYREDAYVDDSPDRGVVEVEVAKNRSGPTARIFLSFIRQHTSFVNTAEPI